MAMTKETREEIIKECVEIWMDTNYQSDIVADMVRYGHTGYDQYSDQDLIDELEMYCEGECGDEICSYCKMRVKGELEIETHRMLKEG